MKLLLLFWLFSTQISAQNHVFFEGDTINRIDNQGRKTGRWRLQDTSKNVTFESQFSEGIPQGNFDYYRNGKIVASQKGNDLIFYSPTGRQYATIESDEITTKDGKPLDPTLLKSYYSVSEMKPQYYGGRDAMQTYIRNAVQKLGATFKSGKVTISFLVDENGEIQNPQVEKSDDFTLNKPALEIISKMPRWQPGYQRGKFVKAKFTIPFSMGYAEY